LSALARRRQGYAFVAVAATGWGLWPMVLARAPMDPWLQSTIVMVVISLAGLPLMLRDRVPVRARPGDWLAVAWLGVADAGNVGLFFAAYQRTSVAIAVLTHYLTPIFVALAAPVVLGERLGRRTGAAVAIAFAGLVLLLEPWRADLSRSDVVGAALGAGSAVFYASNVLVNKRLVPVFSAAELMFFHGFVGGPLLWAFVPRGAVAAASGHAIVLVLAGAVAIGTVGGYLFVWGLRRVEASHASVLTLLEPFVAVTTAALFLGQRIGVVPLGGGALILSGAALVVWPISTRLDARADRVILP
jgi:drug/metabolite transporter (DMT)-like permease